jgi:molybdopterin converting factor small subunit
LDVEIELLGQLKSLAGKQRISVKLDSEIKPTLSTVIRNLSDQLGSEFEENVADLNSDKPRLKALVLKNNIEVSALERLETKIKEGDRLVIIPITHGG